MDGYPVDRPSKQNCDASERWMLDRRSFLLAGLIGLGGCQSWFNKNKTDLSTSELENGEAIYVSDLTRVWGASPTQIEGVGMVSELQGTGSAPRPSRYRDELTEELRVREVEEPNSLLSADWTSLVVIRGWVPAGARKGQSMDVIVGLDPNSDTTSLEGGFLMPARLAPRQAMGGQVMKGRLAGSVTGPVLTESIFGSGAANAKVRGVVAGGGTIMLDRPFGFRMRTDHASIKSAVAVTKAMNARFNYVENSQREPVANAQSDKAIELQIPEVYRDNVYRYLHVLRNVAVNESSSQKVTRMELLEQQLGNPETAEVASLRLEAIGDASVGVLERALRNPSAKVRFMAAMALTYLGRTSGCTELGILAADEWAFRWHAFTALSALPEPEAKQELTKLLHHESVEARYGAVRCLAQRGETENDMSIERFGKTGENFALNTVFSTAPPVIHVAKFKQPELVVFNPDQKILPGLVYVAPNWTIKTRPGDQVEIIQYRQDSADRTVSCSSLTTDLIRTLGQMGAGYSMVVKLLRQAAAENMLEGQLVVNALPQSDRAYGPSSGQSGATPEMFAGESSGESFEEEDDTQAEVNDIEHARSDASWFGKIKGMAKGE